MTRASIDPARAIARLEEIAGELEAIAGRFIHNQSGIHLPQGLEGDVERLISEGRAIVEATLGPLNVISINLARTSAQRGWLGQISLALVRDSGAQITAAARHLRLLAAQPVGPRLDGTLPSQIASYYVSPARIADLKALPRDRWDFEKLVRLCEELNLAHTNQMHFATGMLVRALLDHVPPIFSQPNFAGVANNYPGGDSFKRVMQNADAFLRRIADSYLHTQIRSRESLPTAEQVAFAPAVDMLLAEIVRICSEQP